MSVDIFHKEFRTKRAGLPDLLRYDSLRKPGIVLGKGGELISTFKFRGPDMQCASEADLNFLRVRVSNMVKRLGAGWMLHSTTLRKLSVTYDDNGAFPDPVTRAIEQERVQQYRQEGAHYENDYYLTFTYLPDVLMVSKIKEFAYETSDKGRMNPTRLAAKAVEYFERQLVEYVGMLESGLGTKLALLTSRQEVYAVTRRAVWFDDQLAFFHECLTGKSMPVRLPSNSAASGIDFMIGSYGFSSGIRPILNGQNIRIVAIESPPDRGTQLGGLEVLNRLGVRFRWTTRWIAQGKDKAKARAEKTRSKWRQKIRGFIADLMGRTSGSVNKDAEGMAADAEAVINDLESGEVAYGFWTSTVVLMHSDASKQL